MAAGRVFGQGRPADRLATSVRSQTVPRALASDGVTTHPAAVPRALAGGVGDRMDPLGLLQQRELLLPAADVAVGGAFCPVVPSRFRS